METQNHLIVGVGVMGSLESNKSIPYVVTDSGRKIIIDDEESNGLSGKKLIEHLANKARKHNKKHDSVPNDQKGKLD